MKLVLNPDHIHCYSSLLRISNYLGDFVGSIAFETFVGHQDETSSYVWTEIHTL